MYIAAKPILQKHAMVLKLLFLAAAWFMGAVFGWLYFCYSREYLVLLMRGAPGGAVSIVWSLLVTVFPFVITGLGVAYDRPQALYFICFLKAFFYFTATLSVYGAFGSGGWLMQMLLLFSENISAFLLILFGIGWITEHWKLPMRVLGVLGGVCLFSRIVGCLIAAQILMKIV